MRRGGREGLRRGGGEGGRRGGFEVGREGGGEGGRTRVPRYQLMKCFCGFVARQQGAPEDHQLGPGGLLRGGAERAGEGVAGQEEAGPVEAGGLGPPLGASGGPGPATGPPALHPVGVSGPQQYLKNG